MTVSVCGIQPHCRDCPADDAVAGYKTGPHAELQAHTTSDLLLFAYRERATGRGKTATRRLSSRSAEYCLAAGRKLIAAPIPAVNYEAEPPLGPNYFNRGNR
ncbi:Hypothetical protein NTJ_00308 [Nesidiocoris tenuis]|uniref:Uncharacterized protein n=1 Tax=Nesidiocoris tenuis TaxID=355587 RepID=A0ABN7AB84_9HEMI|nr:Hypothetical protein NTJ_00308 [Nesidiocoris tenuis]